MQIKRIRLTEGDDQRYHAEMKVRTIDDTVEVEADRIVAGPVVIEPSFPAVLNADGLGFHVRVSDDPESGVMENSDTLRVLNPNDEMDPIPVETY